MIDSLQRKTMFALYQCTVILGIALMPVALLARRAGIALPLDSLLRTVGNAYDSVAAVE